MRFRIANLTFGGLIVGIAVVAAEGMARLDDTIREDIPFTASPAEEDLTLRDSLGSRGRPFAIYRQWRLNSAGFRGPEVPRQPREGCTRVAVLGASETFGYYESAGKEYPAQLRDSLSVRGCYEVINAAVAGMSLTAQVRLWENWVSRFSPRIVVIYATPAFYLADDAPKFSAAPLSTSSTSGGFRSRLLDRLMSRIEYPAFIQRRRIARQISSRVAGKPETWLFHSPPLDRLALFHNHLDSMLVSIEAHGAVPIVVTHAMRFGSPPDPADHDLLTAWRQFTPRASDTALLGFERLAAETVRQLARERQVPLADVASVLTGQREYFADFTHFTDVGAGVVAGVIADAVASVAAHRLQEATGSTTLRRP